MEMTWHWWIVIVCSVVYFICGIRLGIDWQRENLAYCKNNKRQIRSVYGKIILIGFLWVFILLGIWLFYAPTELKYTHILFTNYNR